MPHFTVPTPKTAQTKGASGTEYAALMGLIAVLAVGAIHATGTDIREVFQTADAGISIVDRTGTGGDTAPGSGEGVASEPAQGCFEESGENSNNTFGAEDGYTCFSVANGHDELSVSGVSDATVLARNGPKTLSVTGDGDMSFSVRDTQSLALNAAGYTSLALDANNAGGGTITGNGAQSQVRLAGGQETPWALAFPQGDNTIELDGQAFSAIDMGDGNDDLNISSATNPPSLATLNMGGGNNRVDLGCASAAGMNWTETSGPAAITSEGNDNITITNCAMTYTAMDMAPSTTPGPFSLALQTPVSIAQITKASPYTNASITGPAGGMTSVSLDTLASIQQGAAAIDMDLVPAIPEAQDGTSRLSIKVAPDLTQTRIGPDVVSNSPVSISVDGSALLASEWAGVDITDMMPTANHDIRIDTGSSQWLDPEENSGGSYAFLNLFFNNPNGYPNQDIPNVTMTRGTFNVSFEGCWGVRVHAKAGSGRTDITHDVNDCSVYFMPAGWAGEVPYYEGITLTSPDETTTYTIGFNGGPGKNGATLYPDLVQWGNQDYQDLFGPG